MSSLNRASNRFIADISPRRSFSRSILPLWLVRCVPVSYSWTAVSISLVAGNTYLSDRDILSSICCQTRRDSVVSRRFSGKRLARFVFDLVRSRWFRVNSSGTFQRSNSSLVVESGSLRLSSRPSHDGSCFQLTSVYMFSDAMIVPRRSEKVLQIISPTLTSSLVQL